MWLWFWVGYVIGASILGAIGSAIGRTKGRPVAGFWLGAGLGPIGLIIIAVLDRTAEQDAAHMLAVQSRVGNSVEFSQWLSGSAPTSSAGGSAPTSKRQTSGVPDRWREVVVAAQIESGVATLTAVKHAQSVRWAVRGPGAWFFADGDLNFVGVVDGRTIASNASEAREVARTHTITYQPTTAGGVQTVSIGSTVLTNPRPARQVHEFLTRVGAKPTDPVTPLEPELATPPVAATDDAAPVIGEQPTDPVLPHEPELVHPPAATAAGDAVSIRAALTELAALRSEGLVSDEDFAAKRTEILSRL